MASLDEDLRRAKQLATWLDSKFEVAGYKFGVEGLLGFIPVVGDALGTLAGFYPMYVAGKHSLGRQVQAKIAFNLGLEWLLGFTPVVGSLADTVLKANTRNLKLLEEAAQKLRSVE